MGLLTPLAYCLIGGGFLIFLAPLLLAGVRHLRGVLSSDAADQIEGLHQLESSDIPAPSGFVEHLNRIKGVSESATAEQREKYYFDALTRAQTLERENQRLNQSKTLQSEGRGRPLNVNPQPPSPPELDIKVSP